MKHKDIKGLTGVVIIEGHVQGLANTRLLGESGIPVIVLDTGPCVAQYSRYCQLCLRCPDYNTQDFVDFLIRLHRVENLQDWLLLPSNDHAVYNISKNKHLLKDLYRIVTEDLDIIEEIYNKRRLLNIAQNSGIPIPRTVMPDVINPVTVDLQYPIIIKGNNGLSFYKKTHHKAIVVEHEEDLKRLWDGPLLNVNPEEYFIQEVIPYSYKTVSVTVFSIEGEVHSYWMGVKLREHPLKFGTATCCQSMFDGEMLELSKIILKSLRYTGVCEIEWLRDSRDNQPKLIEINARTWLWVGLAGKCGVNYPKIVYDYINKGLIPFFHGYTQNHVWINIYTDIYYSVKRIHMGFDSSKAVLSTYRKFTEACWDFKDPIPFFVYGLLLFRFLRNR